MSYYDKAQELHGKNPVAKKNFLTTNFYNCMQNIKKLIKCNEINIKSNSMTYVFEHIKDTVISLIVFFVSKEDKVYLEKRLWNDYAYRKKLFDVLVELEYKPIMIWIFFHFNYYNLENLDTQRKILLENIEMFSKFFPTHLYFKTIDDIFLCCPSSNPLFSISYHNRNNKTILESYCKLLRKICPDLNYTSRYVSKPDTSSNDKIKVCFFSDFLASDSSVLRDRIGIISQLSNNPKFDVYYMGFKKGSDMKGLMSKTFYNMLKDKYIELPDKLVDARKFIENEKFDILIYCEIGMLMKAIYLAYSRLAPIQLTTWGHSETSGIDTIDYYVSSKYFDTEDEYQSHYSEKAFLMDSLSTYYYPPDKILLPDNYKFKTRKEFNFNEKDNLYGCIQTSFKISDELENMFACILRDDMNAKILLSCAKPFCKSQIDRIMKKTGNNFKRIIFLPGMDITNYLNMISLLDVMIDPYPFGGCNTSMEAFNFNVPVITLPTKYLNGRFTFGMYKKMGFIDLVADSPQSYIRLAVKTATDKQWSNAMVEKIKKNKNLLYQEKASVTEWANLLLNLYIEKQQQ